MNSNFEHLVNTPAPEHAGQVDALRRVDFDQIEFLVTRELRLHEKQLKTDEKMLMFYLEQGSSSPNSAIHNKVDHRVTERSTCRDLLRNIAAIRALRKELGL